MSCFIQVNDIHKTINLTNLDVSEKRMDTSKLSSKMCGPLIKVDDLKGSIEESNFALYIEDEGKIIATLTVIIYGNLWEISYICSLKRGSGTTLINILKNIARQFKPVTLYGLGIHEGSRKLYAKNGFKLDSSYRFKTSGSGGAGKKTRKKRK